MTYTANVSSTTFTPTGDASLSDGVTTMNFITCDNQGEQDELGIVRANAKQTPFVAVFGNIKYDDESPPYGTMVQQNYSGGRGLEDYEDNTTRYYDAWNIDSINGEDGLILNGLPTYATGLHTVQEDWMGNVTWRGLYDTSLYVSEKFTTTSAWNTDTITLSAWIKVRKVGSPTSNLYFKIYSNSSSKPNASVVASAAIAATTVTDTLGRVIQFTLATGTDLATSTDYHVVVYADANGTAASHWEVACDATSTTSCISANGSTWTVTTGYAPYYRFWNTADLKIACHFFEYRGALYLATEPEDGTAGKLYINGWRGACDSNSADLTLLNDATAPGWAADEVNGDIAKIVRGPGAQCQQAWRTISDSTTTVLTMTEDFDIAQTTYSDYVIIGNEKWTEITGTGLTKPVTDVAVVNDVVYMAQGGDTVVMKFQAKNYNGTWINSFGHAGAYADYFKLIYDKESGAILWLGRVDRQSQYTSELIECIAPKQFYDNGMISGLTLDDAATQYRNYWSESDPVAGVTPSYEGDYVQFNITDTFATGIIGSQAISKKDVRGFNKICFRIWSSVDLAEGVLKIVMDNTAKCVSTVIAENIPAMSANKHYDMEISYTPDGVSGAEAIISVGLYCTADQNKAMYIRIESNVRVVYDNTPILLPSRLNAIESYGSPQTLWVICEDEVGYIDNHEYAPSEIKGLKPFASEENGRAHVVDDVYLYFNIGKDMHRYYSQELTNISIYKDAGMPSDRIATPVDAVAFADRIYVAYDGGHTDYSYVACYHGDGWHEVFRAPMINKRIHKIYIQPIPGSNTERLWISMDRDVLWIPVSMNAYVDPDYQYVDEGAIESAWIYGERRDLKKFYKSLKLFCETVSASNYYVQADYKLDSATSWTAISNDFDTIQEEVNFSSSSPPTSTGKRLRYRLRFYTNDKTKSPRLKQAAIKGVGYAKQKYQYSFYFKLKEGDDNEDLQGTIDDTFATVTAALAKLDAWAEEITPLTLRSTLTSFDNKTVFVVPGNCKPYHIDTEEIIGRGREAYFGYVTLLEA